MDDLSRRAAPFVDEMAAPEDLTELVELIRMVVDKRLAEHEEGRHGVPRITVHGGDD